MTGHLGNARLDARRQQMVLEPRPRRQAPGITPPGVGVELVEAAFAVLGGEHDALLQAQPGLGPHFLELLFQAVEGFLEHRVDERVLVAKVVVQIGPRGVHHLGDVAIADVGQATLNKQIAGRFLDLRLHRRLAQLRFFLRSGQAPCLLFWCISAVTVTVTAEF